VDSDQTEKKWIAERVNLLLRGEYGTPPSLRAADPLDILIQTVLSQNTSDSNSRRAMDGLLAQDLQISYMCRTKSEQ
jgi:endonuclease III